MTPFLLAALIAVPLAVAVPLPDDPGSWLDAIDTLGTLGVIVLALWAIYTRRIRTKSEMEEQEADYEKQLASLEATWVKRFSDRLALHEEQIDYIEARRAEERTGRLQAEVRLGKATEAIGAVTRLVQAVREEVTRGQRAS